MISHPDHLAKKQGGQGRFHNNVSVPSTPRRTITIINFESESESESDSGSDLSEKKFIGHRVTTYFVDGEWDSEFNYPLTTNSYKEFTSQFNQIMDKVWAGEATITVNEVIHKYTDDPPPSEEDTKLAIQIANLVRRPIPPVPKPQTTNQPSWD